MRAMGNDLRHTLALQPEHWRSANDRKKHRHKKRNQEGAGRLHPRHHNDKAGQDYYCRHLERAFYIAIQIAITPTLTPSRQKGEGLRMENLLPTARIAR